MRIIGGEFRSRRLRTVRGAALRPTSDRLRETLFNVVGAGVEGSTWIDCYAGSGAVGLEALSRGAARAVFLERSRAAVRVMRENIVALAVGGRARVLETPVAIGLRRLAAEGLRADFIFLDPPYPETEEYESTLLLLASLPLATPDTLIIAEHARRSPTDAQYPSPVTRPPAPGPRPSPALRRVRPSPALRRVRLREEGESAHPSPALRRVRLREEGESAHPSPALRRARLREEGESAHPSPALRRVRLREEGESAHPSPALRRVRLREEGESAHPSPALRRVRLREEGESVHPSPALRRARLREEGESVHPSPALRRVRLREEGESVHPSPALRRVRLLEQGDSALSFYRLECVR